MQPVHSNALVIYMRPPPSDLKQVQALQACLDGRTTRYGQHCEVGINEQGNKPSAYCFKVYVATDRKGFLTAAAAKTTNKPEVK